MPGYVRKRKTKHGAVAKRRDGSICWQARYWDPLDPSRRIERSFGSKRDAERWLTHQGGTILAGAHIDPRQSDRPFADVIEVWRRRWVGLEPKTRVGYEQIIGRHLLPKFGRRKVGSITHEVVQDYIAGLAESGLAPGTVRSIYAALRLAMASGVKAGIVKVNPCSGIDLPRARGRDPIFLSAEEVRTLAETIDSAYRVLVYRRPTRASAAASWARFGYATSRRSPAGSRSTRP